MLSRIKTKYTYISGLSESLDHSLGVPDGGKAVPVWVAIVSVEVPTGQRAPVVADDDSVRVQHRDYLENQLLP